MYWGPPCTGYCLLCTLSFDKIDNNNNRCDYIKLKAFLLSPTVDSSACISVGQVVMYQCSIVKDMIMVQSHGFSTVMCRRDHWCCIIPAPLIYYENVINWVATNTIIIAIIHFMCIVLLTGLRQKYKAPGQVLRYCSAIHRSIYIVLATMFSSV